MDDHNILPYIFSFLKYSNNYRLVCKKWNNLYNKAIKLYEIIIKIRNSRNSKINIKNIKSITIKNSKINKIYGSCSELENLCITHNFSNLFLANNFINIKKLDFSFSKMEISDIINNPYIIKSLEHLDITSHENITYLPDFNKLKKLNIKWCRNISSICSGSSSIISTLEELNISGTNIAKIPSFTGLKKLTMYECNNINIIPISIINTIVELDASRNKNYICNIKGCAKLKILDISYRKSFTNNDINYICDANTNLEELNVNGNDYIYNLYIIFSIYNI